MRTRRNSPSDFNPEKFLAADTKKKGGSSFHTAVQLNRLRPIVVLANEFKEELYARFEKERPEVLSGPADLKKTAEALGSAMSFLKSSLAKEKLKVGDDILAMLHRDFFHGLMQRYLGSKLDDAPESENEEKA